LHESIQQTDEKINFEYLIFVGQAIIGSFSYSDETSNFIKSTFKEYIMLTQKLVNRSQIYNIESQASK